MVKKEREGGEALKWRVSVLEIFKPKKYFDLREISFQMKYCQALHASSRPNEIPTAASLQSKAELLTQ